MTTSQPDSLLNRPGALIAALPAFLGFVPEKSLVLLTVDRDALGAVMRVDLSPELAETIDRIADLASAAGRKTAAAVIIDADAAECATCADDFRRLAVNLSEVLARRHITLMSVHVVDRVAAGGRWHCADLCGLHGAVDDPTASPLAMAAVLDGRRLYLRREDLVEVVTLQNKARAKRVARLIRERVAAHAEGRRTDPDGSARREIELMLAAVREIARGFRPAETDLAAMGAALADVTVRDTLFALAVSEMAADAEAMWALLSRTLPAPWRVDALALLAFSAYARGDGPLAGIALETALRCDPRHRMTAMLDTALQSGMHPEQIRDLAHTGYRLASRLKIQLPAPRFRRRAG